MDSSFYVLGNLPLTALRDKISCLCDYSAMHDCSENPTASNRVLSKVSAFFLQSHVFFSVTVAFPANLQIGLLLYQRYILQRHARRLLRFERVSTMHVFLVGSFGLSVPRAPRAVWDFARILSYISDRFWNGLNVVRTRWGRSRRLKWKIRNSST